MATLTTTPTEVGSNTSVTVGARLLAWYSDATSSGATVHLKLQAISQGTTYTGTNKDYEMILDSTSTGAVSWTYAPLPSDTWVDVHEITQTVNFGSTVSASGKVWTYIYGDAWVTGVSLTMPQSGTAPTGLAISDVIPRADGFYATVSVTDWGGIGDATSRYRELGVYTYDASAFVLPRRRQKIYGNALSSSILCTNGSNSFPEDALAIIPNTQYTLGTYATNGTYGVGSVRTDAVTLAAKPAVTMISRTKDTATFVYSTEADGGFYNKTIKYSLDGGTTWASAATVAGGSAISGAFAVSGLTAGTTYTLLYCAETTAGKSEQGSLLFSTVSPRGYGSVDGAATGVTRIYGSQSGVTRHIGKLYGSVNDQAKLI